MSHLKSYDLLTKFTKNEISEYLNTILNDNYGENDEYETTETEHNESHEQNLILKKSWLINFLLPDDEFTTVFNYNTYYVPSTYMIKILFLEGSDNNVIKFYNCGTSRTKFCHNAISFLKYLIQQKEEENLKRYLTREQFLLLINGCVINYDNFSTDDLQQVHMDKFMSKKRNVLEDPMYPRELLQYLEF